MLATRAACTGWPSRAPSRSTTWSIEAPAAAKARACATGSSLNTVELGEVAPAQPHRAAVLEVDRREEVDHGTPAPLAARTPASQRPSSARPAALDFSGWNCRPVTPGRPAAAQNSEP